MNVLTRRDLEALAKIQTGPCASFYTPVGITNEARLAAVIRLKDRLRECEAALTSAGMRAADARTMLAPVIKLTETKLQNVPTCRGLAIFAHIDKCRIEPLPVEVEDVAWVGSRFYVRPLISLLYRDQTFWLLAISQNKVRFFRGSLHSMTEEHVPNMPGALADDIDTSSRDGTMQVHTAKQGGSTKQNGAYHGQGGLSDHRKRNVTTFFRDVDRALHAHLRGDVWPLVFAGVDYLYPMFASVTHHPHLLPQHIAENPDRLTADELHHRAAHLLRPLWEREQADALRIFESGLGSCEVSDEVHVILPAAAAGRVDSLLLRQSGPLWGRYDAALGHTHLDHEHVPGSEDLLDRACAEVLLHGGNLYAVPWNRIKTGAPMAAIFRYAVSPLSPTPSAP